MKVTKDINVHNSKTKNISIFDLFDDVMKASFNLDDKEYDYLCEHMTDEEMGIMVIENPTYLQKKEMIKIRTKYLNQFKA